LIQSQQLFWQLADKAKLLLNLSTAAAYWLIMIPLWSLLTIRSWANLSLLMWTYFLDNRQSIFIVTCWDQCQHLKWAIYPISAIMWKRSCLGVASLLKPPMQRVSLRRITFERCSQSNPGQCHPKPAMLSTYLLTPCAWDTKDLIMRMEI
jgi:hypothetical protein